MTSPVKKIEVPLMLGTSGYKDYMAFARTAGMALGIKPAAVADGGRFGVPGTTWFGARLRSAPDAGVFQEVEGNVVKLQKLAEFPADAWPQITWDKKNKHRASTTIGIFLNGNSSTIESAKLLISQIDDKKLATKMVEYLEKIAGKGNFVIPRQDAIDWFDAQYQDFSKSVLKIVEAQTKAANEFKHTIGSFNMHAEVLSKAYKKTVDPDQVEDADDEDDAE